MSKLVINLGGLTKHYGASRGISDVNLDVAAGEVFGFLGPNGAGKTTTIRIMLDQIRATSGTAKLFGLDSRNDAVAIHKRVGFVAGDIEIERFLTGAQYLDYIASLHGGVRKTVITAYAKQLDCDLGRKIRHLSRGNKQKVALIAALMTEPDLLILDEPTSGLDPLIQSQFNDIIRTHAAKGKTAFVSSHILGEVQSICDRVGFIREGKLLDVQPLTELTKNAYKKVRVVLRKKSDRAYLEKVPGMTNTSVDGLNFSGRVTGELAPLLTTLVRLRPTDIAIEDSDLEDLFMHYYEEAGR